MKNLYVMLLYTVRNIYLIEPPRSPSVPFYIILKSNKYVIQDVQYLSDIYDFYTILYPFKRATEWYKNWCSVHCVIISSIDKVDGIKSIALR